MRLFSTLGRLAALSVALAAGACGSATAQSSYTLTKLTPPFLGQGVWASCIDDDNHVYGLTDYYGYTVFSFTAPGFVTVYNNRAARWPASTAASVSPVKISQRGGIATYSYKCRKLATEGYLIDLATRREVKMGSTSSSYWTVSVPNEAGTVAWETDLGSGQIGTWTEGGGTASLPRGGYRVARPVAVNSQGDIAGYVFVGESGPLRAAVWFNRVLQVIDQRPDVNSYTWAMNDQRQVVIESRSTLSTPSPEDGRPVYDPTPSLLLWQNGRLTPLLPPGDLRGTAGGRLNNQGVVMGCVGPRDLDACGWGKGRAFIWRDGVMQDLTDLVRSKGASLPEGAVLIEVLALNDAGSFVAVMKTPGAANTVVRLTARP